MSRPRRFGKSLIISTLEAYYEGQRELFKGLALDSLADDWEPHPVLHLDLSPKEYRERESLIEQLEYHLKIWEAKYGCPNPDRSPGMHGRFSIQKFVRAITSGDVETFMRLMETMIAGVPYSEKGSAEAHFQNACYLLFTLLGQFVKMEDRTSDGRINLTVETSEYVYIFEFKTDSTAEEAMEQIKRKRYWLKYEGYGKTIMLIGANFDTRTRRLSGYIVAEESNFQD